MDPRARSAVRGSVRPVVETLAAMAVASSAYWLVGLAAPPLAGALFVFSTLARPWALVTSVYAHAGVGHVLGNAVLVVVAGLPVAATTTRVRFHGFVLATGALAGLAQVLTGGLLAASAVGVVGISGAAFALVGYVLAANPAAEALSRVIDRLDAPPRVVVAAVAAVALLATLALTPRGGALVAHLTGASLGIGAGRVRLLRV